MTSRAESRLYLRQDNADIRLTEIGRTVGTVKDDRYRVFKKREKEIAEIKKIIKQRENRNSKLKQLFDEKSETFVQNGISFEEALRRATISAKDLMETYPEIFGKFKLMNIKQVETQIKYEGYLSRQQIQIEQSKKHEAMLLPTDFDYSIIKGLRIEAQQKLNKIKPLSIGQASRISGVSPADIAVLLVAIKQKVIPGVTPNKN